MVEGETSRIGERSIETISGDTSGRRRDLSNRYSAPVIRDQKIDVEKFDGKINFGMWRCEVMDAFIQIDLDVVLKNKRHLYDEKIWDRMNEKACGQIRSCLTKEVKYLVKDEECAMTLWHTLEEKYLLKSPENRLRAMSQVYGFRMKPGVSMHDHVSRFEKLLADLKNLDEDIKDEVKAMILLHSLPEKYDHFVTTLIYGKSVIVFKDICIALTSLEIQNNDKNSERASSEVLVSRDWAMEKHKKHGGKNSRSKSRSRNIAQDECAFCHEKDHWRKDCPKAQKKDEKKPAAANMARKDEDSDYSLSITLAAYVASSSEWILDTGATYHLCPTKEWFTDFRNLKSGAVVTGNDQPCRTMGIGTIQLKMFDRMVRELKEVRFVPALKKNLIFVGALEVKGYKVTIEDGIMKFTHRAMVILQVVRRHNLYYLKEGTTDEANVAETHNDTTEIWHNEGIKRHFMVRHTPQQNGVAERMNRTLLEKVRSYYHVKDGKRDPRARKAIFVGFKGGVKGFKFYNLEDKTTRKSRREIKKPEWLTKDMVVAYALPVIDDDIPNTFGDAQRILGMKIRRDKKNGSVWLTQKSYLKKMLERFGMDDKTEPVCIPLAPYFKLSSSSCPTSQEERNHMARVPYASVVGSLMYAMVCTRLDISQAVSMVSRYMHNPGKNQWLAVKWILRYLYGTIDVGLLFKKDCGQQCVGYCDSDFAGDLDK
ncbi:hypothetical protein KPL70_007865 [Citrus sinensis]|nr:hypothetical protein KPL70_007865 [Citrus sinensis]